MLCVILDETPVFLLHGCLTVLCSLALFVWIRSPVQAAALGVPVAAFSGYGIARLCESVYEEGAWLYLTVLDDLLFPPLLHGLASGDEDSIFGAIFMLMLFLPGVSTFFVLLPVESRLKRLKYRRLRDSYRMSIRGQHHNQEL